MRKQKLVINIYGGKYYSLTDELKQEQQNFLIFNPPTNINEQYRLVKQLMIVPMLATAHIKNNSEPTRLF